MKRGVAYNKLLIEAPTHECNKKNLKSIPSGGDLKKNVHALSVVSVTSSKTSKYLFAWLNGNVVWGLWKLGSKNGKLFLLCI